MSRTHSSPWAGEADAHRLCDLLFDAPGSVVELRAFGVKGVRGKGIVSGYFDDPERLVAAAGSLDGECEGVYVTLNPVAPALLGRANNRLVESPKSATSDREILRRHLLLIDVDPVRPSGISASEEERQAAFDVLREIVRFLDAQGFPAPVKGDSGNGGHLLYRVDLHAEETELVQGVLEALAFRFDTQGAVVDVKVANAARISKLYGTVAGKGDPLPDRPHRRSRLLSRPEALEVVSREFLQAVADMRPRPKPDAQSSGGGRIEVDAFLMRHGLAVSREGPWQGGRRWVLSGCPFDATHTDGSAYVLQFASGAVAAGCHHNGCDGKDWHTLRGLLEPKVVSRRQPPAGERRQDAQTGETSSPTFGRPEPLPDELLPVLELDPELLPEAVRGWVVDIAERVQCPLIFVAVAVMVGIAGVVGRSVGIRPKRHDDWLVVPNLWGMLIGRPGIMKTPAIQEALKPLKQFEIEAKKQQEAALAVHRATGLVAKEQVKHYERLIRQELKKEGGDPEAVARKAIQAQQEQPTRRRFLVNDATVEKLGEILNQNPRGVLVYRDELMGLLKKLDKVGQEESRTFYLEAWNGNGRFTVDRIGRGTIDIESTTVSVIGSIQPGPLAQYLDAAGNDVAGDDGLVQRFQLAVWPDIEREWVNVDRWPNTEEKGRATELFKRLSQLEPLDVDASREDFEDDDEIASLHFAPEAQPVFDAWREKLELHLRADKEHPAIESHLSKYRSLVPSLALLIHLADLQTGPVSLSALRRAIGWAQVLESHARRIYGAAADRDANAARALARKLLERELTDGFAARDVYRRKWSGLSKAAVVQAALEILVDLGWLVEVKIPTKGRTGTEYLINPLIYEMAGAAGDKGDRSYIAEDPALLSRGALGVARSSEGGSPVEGSTEAVARGDTSCPAGTTPLLSPDVEHVEPKAETRRLAAAAPPNLESDEGDRSSTSDVDLIEGSDDWEEL